MKPLCGDTSIYSLVVVWLLMHDFGLNRWWLWDFQLGPAPGCWGSIIEPRWRWMAPVIHQRRRLEGVTHRRRCWLKFWCTTKLGPGRRDAHGSWMHTHTIHVLPFAAGARGAARSQSSVVIPEATSTATQRAS